MSTRTNAKNPTHPGARLAGSLVFATILATLTLVAVTNKAIDERVVDAVDQIAANTTDSPLLARFEKKADADPGLAAFADAVAPQVADVVAAYSAPTTATDHSPTPQPHIVYMCETARDLVQLPWTPRRLTASCTDPDVYSAAAAEAAVLTTLMTYHGPYDGACVAQHTDVTERLAARFVPRPRSFIDPDYAYARNSAAWKRANTALEALDVAVADYAADKARCTAALADFRKQLGGDPDTDH